MFLFDAKVIRETFTNCFKRNWYWYEASLIFSLIIFVVMLGCIVSFGFFIPIFLLPYFFTIEKACLLAREERKTFGIKKIFYSARRYGRCLCIYCVKLLTSLFSFFSLSFVGHILAECRDLDFKGVLLLSRELTKGEKLKILSIWIFSLFLFTTLSIICFLISLLLKEIFSLSLQFHVTVFLSTILFSLTFLVFPFWNKSLEGLYRQAKVSKVAENILVNDYKKNHL